MTFWKLLLIVIAFVMVVPVIAFLVLLAKEWFKKSE